MGAGLVLGGHGHSLSAPGSHDHDHGHDHGHSHEHSEVGAMITLALFLHKAPEAMSYGTYIAHMRISLCKRLTFVAVSLL